ncbi:MAG: hypothetical protein RL418_147 [Actinomycetota bacterium]
MTKTSQSTWVVGLTLPIVLLSLMALPQSARAVDVDPADGIDDELVVSVAEAFDQSFPDTDLVATPTAAVINFNNLGSPCSTTSLTNSSTIQAVRIDGGNTVNVGTGAGGLACGAANQWGGAGLTGTFVAPSGSGWTLSFTNTQRYLGFWWSAGNDPNEIQLLDENGNDILNPLFDTPALYTTLGITGGCSASNDYCGNPNYSPRQVTNEPFAFIHLRFPNGFRGIRMSGSGFEFDNLTFSETVPAFGAQETIVSDLEVTSNVPDVLLVDPQATSISLPVLTLGQSNDAMLCVDQVSDSSGTALSGSATVVVSRTTSIANVTENTATNLWRYSGTRANVENQIPSIQVAGLSGGAVASTQSRWVRLRLTSAGTDAADCAGAEVSRVVEIRPLNRLTARSAEVSF